MEKPQRRGSRMKSARKVCKECIAHHYWHHMDNPKCFFKVMVGDFKKRMTIPKKFVANINGQMSEQVTLKVPDGMTYTVDVAVEQQNELVLRSGWAEFASAYQLEQFDLLVFKYSGNSHLKVRIFDRSGCEKELSCVLLDRIPCMQERKGSHGKQIQSRIGKRSVGSPSGSRKTPKMNPIDSPSRKKRHVSPTKRLEAAKPPYMLPQGTFLTDKQRSIVEEKVGAIQLETLKMNPKDSTSQTKTSEGIHQEPINSGASQKPIKSYIDLPKGCSMTSEQEAKIIYLEQKMQTKVPFYITALHEKSVASGIMAIKKEYAIKHLVNENGTIQLCQLDGSKVWVWPIKLDISTDDRCAVSKGWMGFIHHNKLQEGDICIFQPSKSKKGLKLIFHALVQSRRLQPPGYAPADKSLRHGAAKAPYMPPRYTSLTDKHRSKVVEEKVGPIRSQIPVYVSVMRSSNVSSRSSWNLGISSAYAREYLPGRGGEKPLRMRMRLRRKNNVWEPEFLDKYGRQQILGKGWKEFVTDNKLKLGDICLFNLVKNTKTLTMDVHILRKRSV